MVQNFLTIEDNSTQLTIEDNTTGLYINDTIIKGLIFKHGVIGSVIKPSILKHNINLIVAKEI
jgi:hypothetical protein